MSAVHAAHPILLEPPGVATADGRTVVRTLLRIEAPIAFGVQVRLRLESAAGVAVESG